MKKLFMLLVLGACFATQLPADFVDGNPLTAAELNQWKAERSGSLKPINASSNSYEDNTLDLGSGSYQWRDAYIAGIINKGSLSEIFGDGSDGTYVSTTNFNLSGFKQYVDFTLVSGNTMTINGNYLCLLIQGTLTLSGNCTITGVGYGAAGGASKGAGESVGNVGSNGYGIAGTGGAGGTANTGSSQGGAGGTLTTLLSLIAGGVANPTEGTGGAGVAADASLSKYYYYKRMIGYGSGGGGGGVATTVGGTSGAGGNGGAGLLIIAKNIIINGTPTITCAGAVGGNYASAANYGGGGGGGGGYIGVYYKTLTGSMPTLNVSGGLGGDGHASQDGGVGGNGYSKSALLQ